MTKRKTPEKRGPVGRLIRRAYKPDGKKVEAARKGTPVWWAFAVLLVIAVLQIEKDPLGLSSLVQQYSSDLINLAVTGPIYGSEGHEKISVAMISEQTLAYRKEHWPIALRTHKLVLDALLGYCPRAVVVDFLFVDPRRDANGLRELTGEIQRYKDFNPANYGIEGCKRVGGVPLYFEQTSDDRLIEPIRASGPRIVDPTLLLREGTARRYPLLLCDGAQCHPSLAAQVFSDLCRTTPKESFCRKPISLGAKPMEIWWGTASDPINVKLSADDESYNACSRTFAWWQRLWRAVFDPASLRSSCPYHSVLPVEALLNGGMENGKPDSDIENLVRDRVVFYGASLHGMGDESVTPVSGLLPDVFVHAMALDNLMTIPGGPLRDLIDLGGWSLTRNQIQIVTIVPVILLLAWIHIIRLRRRTPPQEKASGLAYAIRSIEEFLWWVLTVVLAIAAGVIAMLVTHIAVVTWVGLILVSAEIGAALAAGLPDRLWGYMRHVLTGDGEAPGRQRG